MLSTISNAFIEIGAKIIPASVVNAMVSFQTNILPHMVADKDFKYFRKASDKVDTLGKVALEFVKFCQTYIYIPTLFVLPVIICIFMFGNVQEKSAAKKRVIYIIAGIFMLMALTSIVSMIINAFIADGVKNKLAKN